jgi:hypothetical protein
MENRPATITVARRAPNDVRVRQIYISLDGKRVAELMYGDACTLQVEPGEHWLRANNTLVWKSIECKLEPGEHATFTVINRPGPGTYAMLSFLGSGPIYLSFERTKP